MNFIERLINDLAYRPAIETVPGTILAITVLGLLIWIAVTIYKSID